MFAPAPNDTLETPCKPVYRAPRGRLRRPGWSTAAALLLLAGVWVGCPDRGNAETSASQKVEPLAAYSARFARADEPRVSPQALSEDAVRALIDASLTDGSCEADRHCRSPLRCVRERCALPAALVGDVSEAQAAVTFQEADAAPRFHLEVAATPEEWARGLMHRDYMAPGFGMLFIYPRERILSFWMKDTAIPLDMIFVNEDLEIVRIEHEAEPFSRAPRSSRAPARYVIELVGGEAAQHGLRSGMRVVFDGVD